jgi:predicted RecA/RadA family phage recombinase
MRNFVQPGERITVTASAAASSGGIVKIGSLIGIAFGDAAIGDKLTLATTGVYDLAKVGADDVAVGDVLYHRASDGLVTKTASGNTRIGIAVTAAGNPSASVNVRLDG